MTITATQLKQQTYLIDNAIKEDIKVTKRDRPFVVIVDARRYDELLENQKEDKKDTKTLLEEFDRLSQNVSIIDKDIDIIKLDDEMNNDIF
jgi:PHD/YefM family antitoxin component YafN of YafNO toxin-antitoxin module